MTREQIVRRLEEATRLGQTGRVVIWQATLDYFDSVERVLVHVNG